MKTVIKISVWIFSVCLCAACGHSYSKKESKIIETAQKEWLKTFHSDFEDSQPFKITSKNDTWIVSGALNGNRDGGVPVAVIDTSDLHVLKVYHTK